MSRTRAQNVAGDRCPGDIDQARRVQVTAIILTHQLVIFAKFP